MDLQWSATDLAFQDEVRSFLDEKLTPDVRRAGRLMTSVYADHEASMEWQRILHERGCAAAPAWPVPYGGCDWSTDPALHLQPGVDALPERRHCRPMGDPDARRRDHRLRHRVGCMRKVLADSRRISAHAAPAVRASRSEASSVLRHRMVDMYMELEQAVAAVYLAVLNLETEPAVRARAVSAAKATVGRAARFIGQQAVQLHGGMGMTEELAIGHYFKRLTALQYEFGSTDYHVTRYASLTSEPASRYLP